MPCLWSAGAELFDRSNIPTLDTPRFRKGLEAFLTALRYANPAHKNMDLRASMEDLLNEQCAMSINSTDHVSSLCGSRSFDKRLGFTFLPGKTSVFSGWNLGVGRSTSSLEIAYEYLNWITNPTVSYYLAILSGQSPTLEPYQYNELKRTYPWMDMLQYAASTTRCRLPPMKESAPVIPQPKIEAIVTNLIYDVVYYGSALSDSIQKAQFTMQELFHAYGI